MVEELDVLEGQFASIKANLMNIQAGVKEGADALAGLEKVGRPLPAYPSIPATTIKLL